MGWWADLKRWCGGDYVGEGGRPNPGAGNQKRTEPCRGGQQAADMDETTIPPTRHGAGKEGSK